VFFRLDNQHRASFSKADPCAPGIKRAASTWVQQQERAKAIQR
jgi:hypothetical protein